MSVSLTDISTTDKDGNVSTVTMTSSRNLNDILPAVKGRAALTIDNDKSWLNAYDTLVRIEKLIKKHFGNDPIAAALVKQTEREIIAIAEADLAAMRKWARAVFKRMYATAPVFTGRLRDSIRFMGDYTYFNIGIDPAVIASKEHRRRSVVDYTNPTTKRMIPAKKYLYESPGFDYSNIADKIAVTSNEGQGGPFKFSTWLKAKKQFAKQYGLTYEEDPMFDVRPGSERYKRYKGGRKKAKKDNSAVGK